MDRPTAILDCHLHAAAGKCQASMSNSPRGATHLDTGVLCVSNVKCVAYPAMKRAYLCALHDIGVKCSYTERSCTGTYRGI